MQEADDSSSCNEITDLAAVEVQHSEGSSSGDDSDEGDGNATVGARVACDVALATSAKAGRLGPCVAGVPTGTGPVEATAPTGEVPVDGAKPSDPEGATAAEVRTPDFPDEPRESDASVTVEKPGSHAKPSKPLHEPSAEAELEGELAGEFSPPPAGEEADREEGPKKQPLRPLPQEDEDEEDEEDFVPRPRLQVQPAHEQPRLAMPLSPGGESLSHQPLLEWSDPLSPASDELSDAMLQPLEPDELRRQPQQQQLQPQDRYAAGDVYRGITFEMPALPDAPTAKGSAGGPVEDFDLEFTSLEEVGAETSPAGASSSGEDSPAPVKADPRRQAGAAGKPKLPPAPLKLPAAASETARSAAPAEAESDAVQGNTSGESSKKGVTFQEPVAEVSRFCMESPTASAEGPVVELVRAGPAAVEPVVELVRRGNGQLEADEALARQLQAQLEQEEELAQRHPRGHRSDAPDIEAASDGGFGERRTQRAPRGGPKPDLLGLMSAAVQSVEAHDAPASRGAGGAPGSGSRSGAGRGSAQDSRDPKGRIPLATGGLSPPAAVMQPQSPQSTGSGYWCCRRRQGRREP